MNSSLLLKIAITIFVLKINNKIIEALDEPTEVPEEIFSKDPTGIIRNQNITKELDTSTEISEEVINTIKTIIFENENITKEFDDSIEILKEILNRNETITFENQNITKEFNDSTEILEEILDENETIVFQNLIIVRELDTSIENPEEILNQNETIIFESENITNEFDDSTEISKTIPIGSSTHIHKDHANVFCSSDIILDDSFHLSSDHYSDVNDLKYVWRIIVPESHHQILLQFEYLKVFNNNHINCEENHIEIRNGLSSEAPLIRRICNDFSYNIHSVGRELYIKLVNHNVNNSLQFGAHISNVIDRCHDSINDCEHHCINTFTGFTCSCDEGFRLDEDLKSCISQYSKNGTLNHDMCENIHDTESYKCSWKIRAPHNHRIVLNFTHFNLDEEHNHFYNCSPENYITILEEFENGAIEIEGPYCGNELPSIILSKSNKIGIGFKTNENTWNSEFAVNYHIVKDECAFDNGGCPHECRKTIDSFKCFSCTDLYASYDYEW